MSKAIPYRPEIDGLRTVAVIPVLLFHAGIELFSGGFVGVNIFFVISGYLITKIIATELQSDSFSITTFYQKRIDRLFPVLLSVMTFVIIVGFFVSPPDEFKSLLASVLAALTFTSNIYFWATSDYFAASAFTIPLLHTWSLGIEEQFYIFFPIFLIIAYRFRQQKMLAIIATFTSFIIATIAVKHSATATFYLLPFRAWELLFGSLLALGVFPEARSKLISNLLSLIGMVLAIGSILIFSKTTEFPGLNALAPTLGATLIIYSSTHPQSIVKLLLSSRLMVVTGKASYSLYMWHWPIFVFYGLVLGFPQSLPEQLFIFFIALACGFASWHFIEKTTRGKISRLRPVKTFKYVTLACLPIIAFSSWGFIQHGLPSRVSKEVVTAENYHNDYSKYRAACHFNDKKILSYENSCVLGKSEVYPRILVWGDSHGVEIAAALAEKLEIEKKSVRQITYSSCPPLVSLENKKRKECKNHNDKTLKSIIADEKLDVVVLAVYFKGSAIKASSESLNALNKTVNEITAAGKKVVMMYPLPTSIDSAPSIMARNIMIGRPSHKGQSTLHFLQENAETIDFVNELSQEGLLKVKTWKNFCDDTCYVGDSDGSFFFDGHHPSMHGARKIATSVLDSIREAELQDSVHSSQAKQERH